MFKEPQEERQKATSKLVSSRPKVIEKRKALPGAILLGQRSQKKGVPGRLLTKKCQKEEENKNIIETEGFEGGFEERPPRLTWI